MAQASGKKPKQTEPAEMERAASAPLSEQLARMPQLSLPKKKRTEPSVQNTIS